MAFFRGASKPVRAVDLVGQRHAIQVETFGIAGIGGLAQRPSLIIEGTCPALAAASVFPKAASASG